MTHQEAIVDAFKRNHWRMELGHILKYEWGYEFRARASELRKKGYTIICNRAKIPSENTYEIVPPEENGQIRFA